MYILRRGERREFRARHGRNTFICSTEMLRYHIPRMLGHISIARFSSAKGMSHALELLVGQQEGHGEAVLSLNPQGAAGT